MEILNSLTEEEIINEFETFINLIPDNFLYTPSYFKKSFNYIKNDINELLRISNIEPNYKTYLFIKNDFIEKNEEGKLYFNEEKLIQKFNNILEDFKDCKTEIYENDFDCFKKDIIDSFKQNKLAYNRGFKFLSNENVFCFNIITIDLFENSRELYYTLCHEFCHTFQEQYDYLRTVCSIQRKEFNKHYELATEIDLKYNELFKQKYLSLYQIETQSNVFGSFCLMLKALQTNNIKLIDEIKEYILCGSSNTLYFVNGYFDFPINFQLFNNLEEKKDQYLKYYIQTNGQIDFFKVYARTFELVANKKTQYEEFFNSNPELKVEEYLKNLYLYNIYEITLKDLEEKFCITKSILLEDINFGKNYYIENLTKINFKDSLSNFLLFNVELQFNDKYKSLEQLKQFLQQQKDLLAIKNYEKLQACAQSLIEKGNIKE